MMRKPIIALKDKRAHRGQHAGLLLQRYLCENATGDGGNPEEKRAILQAAINAAVNEEVRALYRIAFDRWSSSLPIDPAPVDLDTAGRLIVGLGSENVLETGIRLHHTYGMPIIPGSALKGLAAHYCNEVWGPTDESFRRESSKYHQLLFGTTDDGGCVTFHDAWLTPDSQQPLVLDVMTPHHPKWLDGSVPPTDFDSPTPVPYLSVTGQFRVTVSWHGPASDKAKNWTELALSLLKDALKDWGVGAKTSSGYGRLGAPNTDQPNRSAPAGTQTRAPDVPQPGIRVQAVLLEEKTKKGGWKAKHDSSGLDGPIQNTGDVPGDKRPGDKVILIVASVNPREIAFRYPTAADDQRATKPKGGPKGSQRPRGRS
ncbi:MAG: type III-B CRISPR module RAMP protein Cmr6 [Isosphaeraceae bacterium]